MSPASEVPASKSDSDKASVRTPNPSTAVPPQSRPNDEILSEEMLSRFASRLVTHDRENRFFVEDFEDLRAATFLLFESHPSASNLARL